MKTDNQQKLRADRVWLSEDSCDLEDFRRYMCAPTLTNAAHWLLDGPPSVANLNYG